MRKCKACGKELKTDEEFCTGCGATTKKAVSKSRKISLLLGLIVLIGLISGHFYMSNSTASATLVKPIYNAIIANNSTELYKHITKPTNPHMSDEELMTVLNDQDMDAFLEKLQTTTEEVQKDGVTRIVIHEDGTELFKIKQRKKLGFYSDAEFILSDMPEKVEATETETNGVVSKGRDSRSIKKLEEQALYTTTVGDSTDEATLYIIPFNGSTEELDESSAFGEEGDEQYIGSLAFYLADLGGKSGYLQSQLADTSFTLNLDDSAFQEYNFNGRTLIAANEIQSSNVLTAQMWTYAAGEMKEINFDGSPELVLSNSKIKFIRDEFMQSYLYDNSAVGWFFTTWKWNSTKLSFTEFSVTDYTDRDEYGWEAGEHVVSEWIEKEHYYVAFPEITLTKKTSKLIEKGMLLDNGIHIGMPIDDVLEQLSEPTDEGYYEGGPYYSFDENGSYFYDEVTRVVTNIIIGGGSLTNDPSTMESLFGVPSESGYDDFENVNYKNFLIGDYTLKIEETKKSELSRIWLRKTER